MKTFTTFFTVALLSLALLLSAHAPVVAQMVTGDRMPGYAETLGVTLDQRSYPFSAHLVSSSIPGNILWPGEQPTFAFQMVNNGDQAIQTQGRVDVIAYGTRGEPGDVWTPHMFKMGSAGSVPIRVNLAPHGVMDLTISPKLPARFGGYALVVDLGPSGRQFLTTCIRTFRAGDQRIQYPHFCLDALPLPVLKRLGVHAIRWGVSYKPTTDKDYARWYADRSKELKAYQDAGIAVLFMVGAGDWNHPNQPLGRPRPWLDRTGTMLDTKTDIAWMPSYDADFQEYVRRFAADYGWPKGPINAFSLWNEPWEGISISGWGADMIRYRDMYRHMFAGVDQARKTAGAQVLVGGCDSTSNAFDKLFPDGTNEFLPMFDFVSIHYQGLDPHSTVKMWVDRKGPNGRVKIWDTESWVANTDDRIAAVVAGDRAAGYDRAMGVFGGNLAETQEYDRRLPDGKTERVDPVNAWSAAASVGAATHFLGERPFRRLLFQNGLPWVMAFDGLPDAHGKPKPEDGTLVVVGDLGEEFGGDYLPFRTARGFAEIAHKNALQAQMAALPANTPLENRQSLQKQLDAPETLSGARLTLGDGGGRFVLYDFYGNPVPSRGGKIVVPLDGRGFFLRARAVPGAFAALTQAVQKARVAGIQPLAVVAHDLTAPLDQHPALRLSLTNVLNRPIQGALRVTLGALTVQAPAALRFGPNETKQIAVRVVGGQPVPSNTYPLALNFNAGRDGAQGYAEDMHVNALARRTITVDGDLNDWNGVLPQTIIAKGAGVPTLTEQAWLPFKAFDTTAKSGLATAYLAADDKNFYFAAKVADDTPDPGTVRFASRDDDEYFYPAVSYQLKPDSVVQKKETIFAATSTEARALQTPDGASRLVAGWEDTVKTFAVDLNMTDGKAHQLALYFLDWDDYRAGRRDEKVTITDAATGKTLDSRDIREFRLGKYLVYTVSGHLRLTLTTNSWISASLSGLFFDPSRVTGNAAGNFAQFVKVDEATQGNWKGVYGSEGDNIIGATEHYPAYAVVTTPEVVEKTPLPWPAGVRRYSYRKDPELPSGNAPGHDNIQIAFNVLPQDQKPWYLAAPGTMPGFICYKDTDYEYALNQVAPQYGGGTEIWRLEKPGMPHKHFYPRQPKSPLDGPVLDGQLVMRRDGSTRLVEAAIPWTEIPDVKKRLDAGQTIKFSFRVNDNTSGPTMELSKGRSVAKRNGSFHVDWGEHWANELEFGLAK